MAKTKLSEWSATASSNTDINSINIGEGMAPSDVNNAMREMMAQLKDFQTGADGDNLTVGGNLAVTGTSTFTGAATFGSLTASSIAISGSGGGLAPVGSVTMYAGLVASPPSGWLVCDGSAISRVTYAALFTALGIAHGAGDGSTTFNLPDLRNKFVIAAHSDASSKAQSTVTGSATQTGGSKDAVNVSHTHTLTDPGHTHSYSKGGYGLVAASGSNAGVLYTESTVSTGSNTTGITVDSAGSSGTNANLPPYYALAFIIKV